ncbi:MAG: hypothetical protein F6K16_21110 [Symploca sp. SIO2B6]|nr:hypothetical protein [Symploca sp. SIO2B6]
MELEIDWLQQLGSSSKEVGNAVILDDNNYYLYASGYTEGALSDNSTNSGTSNAWIAKFYAKSGERIWLQQLIPEDSQSQVSYGIAVDEGGVYAAIATVNSDENRASSVSKFDLDTGEALWTYNFESDSDVSNELFSIVADGNGYLYVTGFVTGSMLSETGEVLTSISGTDAWIAKLSTDCDLVWLRQLGSDGADVGWSIAVDGSGNVYAAGQTTGVIVDREETTIDETSIKDTWIAKYDGEGNRQWIVQFGSDESVDHIANAIEVDHSGGVYATGYTGTLQLSQQTWVAKFRASTGEKIWLNQLGDSDSSTQGNSIAIDNYGGVYVAGMTQDQLYTENQLDAELGNLNYYDAWLAKYDAHKGTRVWLKQVTATSSDLDDATEGITVDPSGSIYVTGYTNSQMSEISSQEGNADIWLAKFREVPQSYEELAQVLKQYLDYKLSQPTATLVEAVDTTSTTTSTNITTNSHLEVAADLVATNGSSTEEETETTTVSGNSLSVLGVVAALAKSKS